MANYPAAAGITTKYGWRFNESTPTVEDYFVISAGSSLVRRFLKEYPIKSEPVSDVVVTIIGGGTPLTEVTGIPQNSGEFRVLYEYGAIEFIQHTTERTLKVEYTGNGSTVLASDFNTVVNYVNRLLQTKNIKAIPIGGGTFAWDSTAGEVTVDSDITFLANFDAYNSLAGVNSGNPIRTVVVPDAAYEIADGEYLYMVIQDDGTANILIAADTTAYLNAVSTGLIIPLFYRVGTSLICLWNAFVLGNGQTYDPKMPGSGAGALTLDQVLTNGNVSALDATVANLITTADAQIAGNIKLDRGVDGSVTLNTVGLSGASRTISFPDADGIVALLDSLTLLDVLNGGPNAPDNDMTVRDVVLRNLDVSGVVTGNIASGTYTPILTAFTNCDTPTAYSDFMYMRINNIVYVTGTLSIDPISTGSTSCYISLPEVDGDFTSHQQAAGTGVAHSSGEAGIVHSDLMSAKEVLYMFITASTSAQDHRVSFMYEIIPS